MDFELIKPLMLGALRHGLQFVAGVLVTWGVIKQDDVTAIVAGLTALAIGLLTMAYNKWHEKKKVETALELPAGASQEQLKKEMNLK